MRSNDPRAARRAATLAVLAFGALVLVAPVVQAAEAGDADPAKLMEATATAMLQDLDTHRAEYRKDPRKVDALVERLLLPHFDSEYAARMVLARHWTSASADQRKRFIDAFYHSLLGN